MYYLLNLVAHSLLTAGKRRKRNLIRKKRDSQKVKLEEEGGNKNRKQLIIFTQLRPRAGERDRNRTHADIRSEALR